MKKIFTLFLITLGSLAKAQTACDSLDITVKYYPFNDTIIRVDVYNNNTSSFLSYPIFTIFDSNGDTVALETLQFFGISQESHHTLNVFPGALPGNTFPGTLTLYYQTVDSYAVCTWPMNFDLCPDTCFTVNPYIVNIGGAEVLGDATWDVLDNNSQVVASGTFTMDTNYQYDYDTVCLDPGTYSMRVNRVTLDQGGNTHVGLESNVYGAGHPDSAFNTLDSVSVDFDFFGACPSSSSVKTKAKVAEASIHSFANNIYISNAGQPIGEISVYSIDGKKVFSGNTQYSSYTLGLDGTGIYIVRIMNKGGTTVRKVYLEQ